MALFQHARARLDEHREPVRSPSVRLSILFDFVAAGLSLPGAILLQATGQQQALHQIGLALFYEVLIFLAVCLLVFQVFRLHGAFWRYASILELFVVSLCSTLCCAVFAAILLPITPYISPIWATIVIQWMIFTQLLWMSRLAYAMMIKWRRARGSSVSQLDWEPVLVVGVEHQAALLIQLLNGLDSSRFQVVGLLGQRASLVGREVERVPVLGTLDGLGRALAGLSLQGMTVRHVVLSTHPDKFDASSLARLREVARDLGILCISINECVALALADSHSDGRPAAKLATVPEDRQPGAALKRAFDIGGAMALLLLFAPILPIIMLAVRIALGRPVLFQQVRPGRGLRPFTLYKIRTLTNAGTHDGQVLPDLQRRTPLGAFLRRSRLDELPQLWNVLAGHMSLVGPRPLLLRDLPDLSSSDHLRFTVRPGVTGWAQVNGGHSLSAEQKLMLDLWYIRHMSPWLDLQVIARTVGMMMFGERMGEQALERARVEI